MEEKLEKIKKLIFKLNEHKKELETEIKNKISITKENYKSVQDEINQLMN